MREIRTKKDEGDDDEDEDDEEFEEDVSVLFFRFGCFKPRETDRSWAFSRTKKSTTKRPLRMKKKKLSLKTMMKSRNPSHANFWVSLNHWTGACSGWLAVR